MHLSLASSALLFASAITGALACKSESSPNPISSRYPSQVSGNLNGTTMIIPISMAEARKVIPAEYGILENAYRHLLPSFPKDMYPMMATGVLDHDLKFPSLGLSLPDFSRAVYEFPFVDLLNDGYSSFRWAATMLITAGSPAVAGSEGYGIKVYPATFDPSCNAYKATCEDQRTFAGTSTGLSKQKSMAFSVKPLHKPGPYPLNFLRNITNQPTFANRTICDNYKRIFNTSLTAPPREPLVVKGSVTAILEPFPKLREWKNIYGWQLSTAFLEPPVGSQCETLKGYKGTGSGDSG